MGRILPQGAAHHLLRLDLVVPAQALALPVISDRDRGASRQSRASLSTMLKPLVTVFGSLPDANLTLTGSGYHVPAVGAIFGWLTAHLRGEAIERASRKKANDAPQLNTPLVVPGDAYGASLIPKRKLRSRWAISPPH